MPAGYWVLGLWTCHGLEQNRYPTPHLGCNVPKHWTHERRQTR